MAQLVHHVRSGDVARPSSMFPATSVAAQQQQAYTVLDAIGLVSFLFLSAVLFI